MRPGKVKNIRAYSEPRTPVQPKDNPHGCGIQFWKNPTKIIFHHLSRDFLASEQVRLTFDPQCVVMEGNADTLIEVPQARFISRSFRNANIASLTLSQEALFNRQAMESIRALLTLGEMEKVKQISASLPSKVEGMIFSPLGIVEKAGDLIPGTFKHYTDHRGWQGIVDEYVIFGAVREKAGEKDFFVSASRLSLCPEDVRSILFSSQERERIPGRGEYVIAFDLKDGSPQVKNLRSDQAIEVWIQGNLYLSEIDVTYQGRNPLAA